MKAVVHTLEGEVNSLKVPPNPLGHADGVQISANIPGRPINIELVAVSYIELGAFVTWFAINTLGSMLGNLWQQLDNQRQHEI
ncbi:hypothetical protein SLEP1_g40030 [Rubroshorea leprosula]|uniref:Uncharacterized protein n=1 Tax=Rubroshorea leprosula TaxID=152421 RepID=A0AAV5L2E2_9ROSI|nr:hypothetical protein SLEP1_g40030 [Rubroshorea leprosula]